MAGRSTPIPSRPRDCGRTQAFFRKALASQTLPRVPRKVILDGHRTEPARTVAYCRARPGAGGNVKVRAGQNPQQPHRPNHRAIKRHYASMAGFKSFTNAAITIAAEIELAHRIRKGQFSFGRGRTPPSLRRGRRNGRWPWHRKRLESRRRPQHDRNLPRCTEPACGGSGHDSISEGVSYRHVLSSELEQLPQAAGVLEASLKSGLDARFPDTAVLTAIQSAGIPTPARLNKISPIADADRSLRRINWIAPG